MAKGTNRAAIPALGRLRRGRTIGVAAVARARANQRRRGAARGGTLGAIKRLRNRPAGLTSAVGRAQRNARRRNRAR